MLIVNVRPIPSINERLYRSIMYLDLVTNILLSVGVEINFNKDRNSVGFIASHFRARVNAYCHILMRNGKVLGSLHQILGRGWTKIDIFGKFGVCFTLTRTKTPKLNIEILLKHAEAPELFIYYSGVLWSSTALWCNSSVDTFIWYFYTLSQL